MSKRPIRGLSPEMLRSVPARDTPDILAPPTPSPPTPTPAPVVAPAPPPAAAEATPAPTPEATPVQVDRGPSTQTVKVPDAEFIRLKMLSARTRRRHQDIILTALREYLDRHGG